MAYKSSFDPSDMNYNPCQDGVRGCLLCVLAALADLESETERVSQHPEDKKTAEMLQLRTYQLKEVMKHALYREFFMESMEV